uniref:RING-type domain-containing protein n=1 Tax=Tetraselmis sp. GSL018 TaxID=582737 RepID=A0A061RWT9_9CHLO
MCGELCEQALRFIQAQTLEPLRQILRGDVPDEFRSAIQEVVDVASGRLVDVTFENLYAALLNQDNEDGGEPVMCPICYESSAELRIQDCRCTVNFRLCWGCASNISIGEDSVRCPHCRSNGIVMAVVDGGGAQQ